MNEFSSGNTYMSVSSNSGSTMHLCVICVDKKLSNEATSEFHTYRNFAQKRKQYDTFSERVVLIWINQSYHRPWINTNRWNDYLKFNSTENVHNHAYCLLGNSIILILVKTLGLFHLYHNSRSGVYCGYVYFSRSALNLNFSTNIC